MTGRIEKTVFISYRHTNLPWALNIYQDLTHHGYDVFFDYQGLNSGDFEPVILGNIRARAHFVVVLTPSALERCNEPGDWLRREIECAMDEKRNIVPLMLESFDFGSPLVMQALTGKLAVLSHYQGLRVYSEYFFEAMERLRDGFLKVTVGDIYLPSLNAEAKEITEEHQIAASGAGDVKHKALEAQLWFERGYEFWERRIFDEAIRCYDEAIRLLPEQDPAYLVAAYNNRGIAHRDKGNLNLAIADFNEAIRLEPEAAGAYDNRGQARHATGDAEGALTDYAEAIRLLPTFYDAYFHRALAWEKKRNDTAAIADYQEYLRLGGGIRNGDEEKVHKIIRRLRNTII